MGGKERRSVKRLGGGDNGAMENKRRGKKIKRKRKNETGEERKKVEERSGCVTVRQ